MDNLITTSDFVAPYKIIANSDDVISRINDVIALSQEYYLRRILGTLEYNKLTEADLTGSNEWTRFVNGYTYTLSGFEYKYEGIKKPLAMLCFCDIQQEFISEPAPLGYIKRKYKNGKYHFDKSRIFRVYKEARDMIITFDISRPYYPTVERFLNDFPNDYPDLDFRPIKPLQWI